MKSYQVEIVANKGHNAVYTCTMIAASTEKSAINKAVRMSKQEGYTGQRSIKAFEHKPCRYADALPF
jgi:hypothetical protein